MNGELKARLSQLYTKKGELITDIEVSQAELRSVNEEIVKLKNKEAKQAENKKGDDN